MSHFVPPYPKPMTKRSWVFQMMLRPWKFLQWRTCSIRSLSNRAYEMHLGEIRLPLTTIVIPTQPDIVKRVLVEEGLEIARELYLGVVIDRAAERPVVMASPAGGMEIERVAAETPGLIFKEHAEPGVGLALFQARRLGFALGLDWPAVRKASDLIAAVYRTFIEADASLVEVNPLVLTGSGDLLALDAKMNLDDNALYRHPDLAALRDLDEEEPLEVEASRHSLNYIRLDGTIGCMVNGAGLAMATMDIIKLAGGEPANFLDVGGGANKEKVTAAFKIITAGDYDDMKAYGTYSFYRVGITPNGVWKYFISGD